MVGLAKARPNYTSKMAYQIVLRWKSLGYGVWGVCGVWYWRATLRLCHAQSSHDALLGNWLVNIYMSQYACRYELVGNKIFYL